MSAEVERWAAAIAEGVASMRSGIFSLFDGGVRRLTGALPEGLSGAWVSYVGQRLVLELAVLGDEPTLRALTTALTGIEDPSELAVTDAVIEVTNILGGVAKRRIVGEDPTLRTGMPKFLFGRAVVPAPAEVLLLEAGTVAGPIVLAAIVHPVHELEAAGVRP